jgi:hypothetical protein
MPVPAGLKDRQDEERFATAGALLRFGFYPVTETGKCAEYGYDQRHRLNCPLPVAVFAPYLYFEITHMVPW